MTLAEIEASVLDTIRFRAASPQGREAIQLSEQIIAEVAKALQVSGEHQNVTGIREVPDGLQELADGTFGRFMTTITGKAEHKFVFAVRVTGAYGIDVRVHVHLVPPGRSGAEEWQYKFANSERARRLGAYPASQEAISGFLDDFIPRVKDAALSQAKAAK